MPSDKAMQLAKQWYHTPVTSDTYIAQLADFIDAVIAEAIKQEYTRGYNDCAMKWSKEIERLKSTGYVQTVEQARLDGARAMQAKCASFFMVPIDHDGPIMVTHAQRVVCSLDPQQVINESVK